MSVGIIDYGMGNLKSIYKAMEYLGYRVKIIETPDALLNVDRIILPGVGAFPRAMENLAAGGFINEMKLAIDQGKPFLGICLGMQLLFEKGYEDREVAGLGILQGEVKRLDTKLKIPHMGWNRLCMRGRTHPLFARISSAPYMYFVHSFALSQLTDDVIGYTVYGKELGVAVARNNVFGVQFHPEKSGEEGLRILRNFGEMV